MVKCKFCNTPNELDRFLCVSCGKKLDLTDPQLFVVQDSLVDSQDLKNKYSAADIKSYSASTPLGYWKWILFLLFILFYLALSTSPLPKQELKLTAAQSLDEKLALIQKQKERGDYLNFTEAEINVYLERQILSLKEKIQTFFPRFLTFQKVVFEIRNVNLIIHILFKFYQKPLLFSFEGILRLKENEFQFEIFRSYLGRLKIPFSIAFLPFKQVYPFLGKQNFFKKPFDVTKIKLTHGELSFFFPGTPNRPPDEKEEGVSRDLAYPPDLLLIQAADHFFNQKKFRLACQYYQLSLIQVPKSPLKEYTRKQIRLCQENF